MTSTLHISEHAISRFIGRVDRLASRLEARIAIGRLASLGRTRTVPRHWMRRDGIRPQPGLPFVYSSYRPGVCLLIRDGTVLTVITHQPCAADRRPAHLRPVEETPRPMPVDGGPRWRWGGTTDSEEAA
jgi:hypothetical protein